jgi:hypothetical protein
VRSSRIHPEEHPIAAMMAMTALMGASTLKDQLGDPLYALSLLATADGDEGRVLMGEEGDPSKERPAAEATLLVDDPDVHWIAEAALDAARQAADSGMDTAGYPLTAGLVLLTMNGPEAYLRLAFAWKDDVGKQIAERLEPEVVRMAQALGW